ncbi:MAG TPA: LPS export ABC transporter permease LptG [Burkholderiales bacterium]|nr:LPS export ABC transporter permease LptG [Burkholderiales bacterium]
MKILQKYLARRIFASTLLVFSALLGLFTFLDLIHELSDIGIGNYHLLFAFAYVLLSIPGHVYELFPIASLIGTIFALSQLGASSEVTVMRVSGMSGRDLASFLLRAGLIFVTLTFLFGELLAPMSDAAAQKLRLSATKSVIAQEFRSGLWVKDESSFINVREVLPDTTLVGVRIFEFDSKHDLKSISFAKKGSYRGNNFWELSGVVRTSFGDGNVRVSQMPNYEWKSVLTPDMLSVLLIFPEHMSILTLHRYIRHLVENKQQALRYQIAFWTKIVYPFAVLVMMLIALPFAYHRRREGGISAKIVTGIMIGLVFYLMNQLSARLGLINGWPPFMAAASPTIAFLIFAVAALWRVERR